MADLEAAYRELWHAEFDLSEASRALKDITDQLEAAERRFHQAVEREEAARKAYEAFPYAALTGNREGDL